MKDECDDLKFLLLKLYARYSDVLKLDSLPEPNILNDDSDNYDKFGYEINFDIDLDDK